MAEEVAVRATLRDELSQPLRRVRREVDALEKAIKGSTPALSRASRGSFGLERALGGVDRLARRTGDTLNRVLHRGLVRVTQALGAGVAAAVFFGLRAAASFEQTRIALDGMLGSAEAGKRMFSELQQFNLKTPFRLSSVTGGARQLLGFGFEQPDVMPLLSAAANAAAGLGAGEEGLQRILLNLGQVRAMGVVTGRELRDFATLGFPGYELVADILGMTREEIRALGDDAQVSADDFLGAVARMQGPLQRFNGMAEAQMQSLSGLWSNFMDVLEVRLADASSPLAAALKNALPQLTAFVGQALDVIAPPLLQLGSSLIGVLTAALPTLQPVLSALATGAVRLVTALLPGLRAMEPVAGELADSLVELVDALVPVMPDLAEAFVALVRVLPEFVRLLAALVPLTAPILRLVGGFLEMDGVSDMMAGLLVVLLGYKALSGVVGTLVSFANALGAVAINGQAAAGVGGASGAASLGTLAAGGAVAGGIAAAGWGILGGNRKGPGDELATIGGFAAAGAGLGSIIPGAGTLAGGIIGALVGGAGVLGRNLIVDAAARRDRPTTAASARSAPAGVQSTTYVAPNAIQINGANLTQLELEHAVTGGIQRYERDRAERAATTGR